MLISIDRLLDRFANTVVSAVTPTSPSSSSSRPLSPPGFHHQSTLSQFPEFLPSPTQPRRHSLSPLHLSSTSTSARSNSNSNSSEGESSRYWSPSFHKLDKPPPLRPPPPLPPRPGYPPRPGSNDNYAYTSYDIYGNVHHRRTSSTSSISVPKPKNSVWWRPSNPSSHRHSKYSYRKKPKSVHWGTITEIPPEDDTFFTYTRSGRSGSGTQQDQDGDVLMAYLPARPILKPPTALDEEMIYRSLWCMNALSERRLDHTVEFLTAIMDLREEDLDSIYRVGEMSLLEEATKRAVAEGAKRPKRRFRKSDTLPTFSRGFGRKVQKPTARDYSKGRYYYPN